MRKFIKKLNETSKGSSAYLTEQELSELIEFFDHNGYRIVAEKKRVIVEKSMEDHIINVKLTENDAVRLFKTVKPVTYSKKSTGIERTRIM